MSRKPLIAGNWKMNHLFSKVPQYFSTLIQELQKAPKSSSPDVLLAVPAPFLALARECAEKNSILIAAQNVHEKPDGAFTGEVSLPMLRDLGIGWTLVGHSERRQYFNESDSSVARKALACVEQGVVPIVCIGETLEEREKSQTESVLKRQLLAVLDLMPPAAHWVIAYEPVWAIGTGLTASDAQAQAAHAFIRQQLRLKLANRADDLRILYGGSVKPSNVQGLMQQEDIDGALVGGASLDPAEFARIVSFA